MSETETESASESEVESDSGDQSDEAEQETQQRSRSLEGVDMTDEEKTDPESVDAEDVDADESIEGVLGVRRAVESTAGELIGQEFDSVTEIVPTEDGWRAVVDVVERRSVPDTQDVMGRYEVELSEDVVVHGYRRLDRYRRGDTAAFE